MGLDMYLHKRTYVKRWDHQEKEKKHSVVLLGVSHFTVLVIGENPEEQLAPFQENNMGDCPEEFLEFHDMEDELRDDYETDTVTKVVMPDGRLLSTWDDEFKVSGSIGIGTNSHNVPDHLEKRDVPVKEIYKTFDEYAREYHGYKKDQRKDRYGYWENPNAKWDWYSLGGRWAGFFNLRPNREGIQGHHRAKDFASITGEVVEDLPLTVCDQAAKKDIDFEFMRNEAEQLALKKYEAAEKLISGLPIARPWAEIGKELNYSDEARALYHSQPRVKAFKNADNDLFGHFTNVEEFQITKEQYLLNARNSAISTHAVIKDGKWYERGKMGWWAVVHDEKDSWDSEFSALLDSVPDDTLLSVYDCHI